MPLMDVVSEVASSLDVTKLGNTGFTVDDVTGALVDIAATLNSMDARMQKIEKFLDDARAALDNMPALPFLPKFPRSNGK